MPGAQRKQLVLLFLFLWAISSSAVQVSETHLCPHVILRGRISPTLSDVEKRLVCGEPQSAGKPVNEGWAEIPFSQAKFNLTGLLQGRGYLHPVFREEIPNLIVEVGGYTVATEIKLEGDLPSIEIDRKRQILGQPMTPSLLNSLEKWVSDELQTMGYACPEVTSQGNSTTGEIRIKVKPGPHSKIIAVTQEAIAGLEPDLLRRYDAFKVGDLFDRILLEVTNNRIKADRIVESSYFRQSCQGDGVTIQQEVVPGPPRLLTAGLGLNTEGAVLGKVSLRNTRLGRMGSLLDLSTLLSSNLQKLEGKMNWYFLPYVSRFYLNPSIQMNHRNEKPFELLSTRTQIGLATTADTGNLGISVFLGPSLDLYRTLRGTGATNSTLLTLENRASFRSHDFEYYLLDPQSGFKIDLVLDFTEKALISDFSAQRVALRFQSLWNISHYDPPLWVIGLRGGLTTVLTAERPGQNTLLPASYLQYLGGSADLRGFGRLELPRTSTGNGLTSGFVGLEARLSHVLPARFDPFIFIDLGAIGAIPGTLDLPVYWSPGLGLRWASPAGPIRTTFAHGYEGTNPMHWQAYFSFGEEF